MRKLELVYVAILICLTTSSTFAQYSPEEYAADSIVGVGALLGALAKDDSFLRWNNMDNCCRPALVVWFMEKASKQIQLNLVERSTNKVDYSIRFDISYSNKNQDYWRDLSRIRADMTSFILSEGIASSNRSYYVSVLVFFTKPHSPQKGWESAGPDYPMLHPYAVDRVQLHQVVKIGGITVSAKTLGLFLAMP